VTNTIKNNRKITSGTKEWADKNINIIKGCVNNCRYCYAKMMAKRFGRCTDETWENMEIRWDRVNKSYKKFNGRVMFPSSHDIVDIPMIKEACFIVLEKLLKAQNQVLLTTKPNLAVIKDVINHFNNVKELIQFRFTITSNNDELLTFWEPNAPLFEERLESLILAFNGGFKTSVSVEPFLDIDPKKVITELAPYVTESIWIGPMNYISRNNIGEENRYMYDIIRDYTHPSHLMKIYQDLKHVPRIRFKDSMRIKLGLD